METVKFNEFLDNAGGEREIDNIYTGKESGCRCGCSGRYFEPGERGWKMALNKIRKANPETVIFRLSFKGEDDERTMQEWSRKHLVPVADPGTCYGVVYPDGTSWVDWCCAEDRTVTVYFGKDN